MRPETTATELVTKLVEEATGKPVLVTADPALRVLSTTHTATAASPAHVIRYSTSAAPNADYLTCFQCGFILRMAQISPDLRFNVGSTYRGRKEVEQLLRDHARLPGSTAIPKQMRDGLRDQMYDGLIRQLRSVPIGLRIDQWLSAEFPALAGQQKAIANHQLRENLTALAPEIRKLAPAKIFAGNAAMNAAFAGFWARAWDDQTQVSPFKAAGFLAAGDELISIFDRLPADAEDDRDLLQAWGDHLSLSGWFEFAPYHG